MAPTNFGQLGLTTKACEAMADMGNHSCQGDGWWLGAAIDANNLMTIIHCTQLALEKQETMCVTMF
jgi:hypothetical protein